MELSEEEILERFHDRSELYNYLADLHDHTYYLYNDILQNGVENVKLIELQLAELFSLYNTVQLFLSIKADLHHYEVGSLLNFWKETYYQFTEVARHEDENTSWLQSNFRNYSEQYDLVEVMLKDHIEELKKRIK